MGIKMLQMLHVFIRFMREKKKYCFFYHYFYPNSESKHLVVGQFGTKSCDFLSELGNPETLVGFFS
jgi:hypothetical protein